jgi:ubiquinone/menaquinone biosynthesis C-methylase UbiE
MPGTDSCKLFEQISNASFTATGIRPGGLDLTQQALARSKLTAGSMVLDVGCGTGVTVEYLLYERVIQAVGIDLSSILVTQGKSRDVVLPLLVGDAGVLPFSDGSFDGVLLECTLSLVRDRERVLKECHRVLRMSGRLIVTDLYARNPEAIGVLRRLSLQSCLEGALNKDEFIDQCSVVGFALDCFEDHSEMLRDFATQIVWTYGSLDRFWTETGASSSNPEWIRYAIREARPGYFLYVGCKAAGVTGADGKWEEK